MMQSVQIYSLLAIIPELTIFVKHEKTNDRTQVSILQAIWKRTFIILCNSEQHLSFSILPHAKQAVVFHNCLFLISFLLRSPAMIDRERFWAFHNFFPVLSQSDLPMHASMLLSAVFRIDFSGLKRLPQCRHIKNVYTIFSNNIRRFPLCLGERLTCKQIFLQQYGIFYTNFAI